MGGSNIAIIANRKFFGTKLSKRKAYRALKFGWPEVPNTVVSMLYAGFDKTILVNQKGLAEVGLYEFGGRFAGVLK